MTAAIQIEIDEGTDCFVRKIVVSKFFRVQFVVNVLEFLSVTATIWELKCIQSIFRLLESSEILFRIKF